MPEYFCYIFVSIWLCTIQMLCESKCVLFEHVCVYVCSSLRQERENCRVVLIYVYVCVCTRVNNEVKSSGVGPLTECVWILFVGDSEIHEKFSILKDYEYTNFDMAMNVVLLAVCSPIFDCISEAVCDESLRPESECARRLSSWECEGEWKRLSKAWNTLAS